ncbi:MAG: hypothetical protein DWQ01_07400 [Planctomycetota bacterium]|nr:MAG: hypothetical protein DWQ01_07400 [Planctomycetota bacterium]
MSRPRFPDLAGFQGAKNVASGNFSQFWRLLWPLAVTWLPCGCGLADELPPFFGEVEGRGEATAGNQEPEQAVDSAVAEQFSFLPVQLHPPAPSWLKIQTYSAALDALRIGQARQAAITLEQARRDRLQDPDWAALHAWALLEMGEREAALELAVTSQAEFGIAASESSEGMVLPRHEGLVFVEANAQYLLGNLKTADPLIQEALEWRPSDPLLLQRGARCALAASDGARAVDLLDRLVLLQPISRDLSLLRARALSQAQRYEAAMQLYDRLLLEDRNNPSLWNEAGVTAFDHAFQNKQPEGFAKSASYFSRALDLNPQDARVQFHLGCALDWGERKSEAEQAYHRAIELRPGYMEAVENLVDLLEMKGDLETARKVLTEQLRQPLTAEELQRTRARLLHLGEKPVTAEGRGKPLE